MDAKIYLFVELVKREIKARYKGSFLGLFWAILTPLGMLLVFSFVFGSIFKAKWGGGSDLKGMSFTLNLFIGLSVFWFFSDIVIKSSHVFSSVPNYVKKVVFPLGLLPFVNVASALFHLFIYFIIIFIIILFKDYFSLTSVIYSIAIISLMIPMGVGIGYLFGSIGVYIRDISSVIEVSVNMLMFLSPVFYPLSNIDSSLRWMFELNPLTLIIEELRKVLIMHQRPDMVPLLVYLTVSLAIYMAGHRVFRVLRKGFADVL